MQRFKAHVGTNPQAHLHTDDRFEVDYGSGGNRPRRVIRRANFEVKKLPFARRGVALDLLTAYLRVRPKPEVRDRVLRRLDFVANPTAVQSMLAARFAWQEREPLWKARG